MADRGVIERVAQWAEQLLKINSAEYRAYHDEASQLLTYSVQAHDTELATQNIAIETLKLSNRASDRSSATGRGSGPRNLRREPQPRRRRSRRNRSRR